MKSKLVPLWCMSNYWKLVTNVHRIMVGKEGGGAKFFLEIYNLPN